MKQPFFARRGFLLLLVMAFLMGPTLVGAVRALRSNRNDVKDWLPENFEETATHRWFKERFPHERFVLLSWKGCTLDDPRLEFFAQKLEKPSKADLAAWRAAAIEAKTVAMLKMFASKPDASAYEEPWPFRHVLTGERLVEELESRYEDLEEEELLSRLEGSLIGDDHSRTCLVVTLAPTVEHKEMAPALDTLRRLAVDCGINASELRLGGPPVDNVAIDVEGQRTLFRLAGLSAIIGLTISWFCFRSVRLTMMVFFCAILATGFSLAAIYWTNLIVHAMNWAPGDWPYGVCDAIVLTMPSLVYVLALSGSIHIINYYHDAIHDKSGLHGAPDRAISHAWYPCTIAALTTALGLGSLCASHVVPISKFGIWSAWGVMATLAVLFLFLPALLQVFPSRQYADRFAGKGHEGEKENPFIRLWQRVGGWVIRHNVAVSAVCLVVMIAVGAGVYRIKTSVKLMKLFSSDSQIIQDYGWLEEQLGPLVPMEVVVRIDNEANERNKVEGKPYLSFVDRMRLVEHVELAVESLPDVGGALSAATFAPNIAPDDGARILGYNPRDRILNRRLEEHRAEFREYLTIDYDKVESRKEAAKQGRELPAPENPTLGQLGIEGPLAAKLQARRLGDLRAILDYAGGDPIEERLAAIRGIEPAQAALVADAARRWRTAHGEELWRVSARVAALSDLDYGHFVEDLKRVVEPVLAAYREAGYTGIQATYTGLVPLVYKTQHELMRGLFSSLAYAFVLIAAVMMFVLRSPSAGLLAMVPNLFPILIVFGFMGWSGILVDIGSMMTSSVALGVAVDDTIHYLTWYRHGLDEGRDRKSAAMWAYERCATAMTQTTLIAGLGLAAFCFSTFTPTQRFGTLMLAILCAALVGDLIFLPALLTGPLGWFFSGRRKKNPKRPPLEAGAVEPRRRETADNLAAEEVVAALDESSPPGGHYVRRDQRHRSSRAT